MARRVLLAALVLLGAFLRFRAANHPYISQWDESYHALVAKNLTKHPLTPTLVDQPLFEDASGDWKKAHVWLHKPPLPLWLMASSLAIFGDETETIFRLPSVALDSAVILLIFLIALELFGSPGADIGLCASALYAVNPLMIRLVSGRIPDDHGHVINAFFVILTVFLFLRAARSNSRLWSAAAGISLGLGTLCMSAVALLGLAVPLPLLHAKLGPKRAGSLLIPALIAFLVVALPWPVSCLLRWPALYRHESGLQTAHLFTAIDGHSHAFWWYLSLLPQHFGGPAILNVALIASSLAFICWSTYRKKNPALAAVLLWAILPYVFFSSIATKMYTYVSIAVPAVCLLIGYSVLSTKRYRAVAVAVLILQVSSTARERFTADYHIATWNTLYDYPSFREALLRIGTDPGKKVVFNVGDGKTPQAMYYADCSAYEEQPSVEAARRLLEAGYHVYVLSDAENRGAPAFAAYRTAKLTSKLRIVPLPAPAETDPKHPYDS